MFGAKIDEGKFSELSQKRWQSSSANLAPENYFVLGTGKQHPEVWNTDCLDASEILLSFTHNVFCLKKEESHQQLKKLQESSSFPRLQITSPAESLEIQSAFGFVSEPKHRNLRLTEGRTINLHAF